MTVSRSDLEAKAMELVGAVDETRRSAKNMGVIAVVALAVIIGGAFVVGRRRGARNKTVVEVYRV